MKVYNMLRPIFLKKNPWCAIFPKLRSTQVHHTYSGSKRDEHLNDVASWMAVSQEGHDWIHANVALSYELGYLK